MPFRISQERCAGAPATFRLAGRLADDAVEVLIDACVEIAAGAVIDLSEVSYADDAGVKALGDLRVRGAVLQGSRPYLALLLQQEEYVDVKAEETCERSQTRRGRHLFTLVLLCIAAWGCRAAPPGADAPSEPPPPLIEPEVGPGAGLVDSRADALVRQMSERLARAGAFALEAEELYDEVPEHSPRRQLTSTRHVALRRPDRLVGDASGDAVNRSFWYDGKVFAALDKEQHRWASGDGPADRGRGARLGVRADRHRRPPRRLPVCG